MVGLGEDADLDGADGLREVGVVLQVDLVEQVQVHPIQPLGDDDRVVERPLRQPAPVVRLQRLPYGALQLIACPAEDHRARAPELRRPQRFGVRRVEPARQLRVELVERALVAPARHRAARVERVAAGAEEPLGAAVPHERRETLVERRLARHVQRVVRQLMQHRRHQLHRIAIDRGREQRVAEVAERRKRRRRAQVGVVPLVPERPGLAAGPGKVEEPLVGHQADDREVPGVLPQLVLAARREHEQQRVAAHAHIRRVGLPRGEAQRVGRERPRGEHQAEALLQSVRHGGVGEQLRDRPAPPQDARLFESGPRHVPRVGAERQRQPEHHEHAEHAAEQHAPDDAPPRGTAAFGQGVHRNPTRCVAPPNRSNA